MPTRKSPSASKAPVKRAASRPAARRLAAPPARGKQPAVDSATLRASVETSKAKQKLVRDSFTIPKGEYSVIGELKQRALRLARPVKKSELLRAGVVALSAMGDQAFLQALSAVPSLKTGRPKKAKLPVGRAVLGA